MVNIVTDAEYLKSRDLGSVIAKGMAVMYEEEPKNPVDFLAKWLLNYSQVERVAENREEELTEVKGHIGAHAQRMGARALEAKKVKKAADAITDEKTAFRKRTADAVDLCDNLQDLTDHLKKFTNASATYVGKLVSPKKPIDEGDNDSSHIDNQSDQVIHFTNANEEHSFIVDKMLSKGLGLTFDVFTDKPVEEGKEPAETDDLNHILVPEVVREPKMHFFKVPRLGSYLAIRLEYESCLFVDAYNAGITDALSCAERKKEQEDQKVEHEAKEAERRKELEDQDQEYVRDDGNWPEIKPKAFLTQKVSYVVCLNTLGQDRQFTAEEIKFALDTTKYYRDEWQNIEQKNLRMDINRKLNNMEAEKLYKEVNEALDIAEADRLAEEATKPQEDQDAPEESVKQQAMKKCKWQYATKMFYDPEGVIAAKTKADQKNLRTTTSDDHSNNTSRQVEPEDKYIPLQPEYWQQPFLDLKGLNIMKMPRVLQTLFYLLKYEREDICEVGTNKLDFKKVKNMIEVELFQKMSEYNPFGQRNDDYKEYQKLAFLQKNIDSVEEEKVDEYSVILGRIHRWITQTLDLRTEDVRGRRDQIAILTYERESALTEDKVRNEKREAYLEEKKAEHEEKENDIAKKFMDDQDSHDEDNNPIQKLDYERQEMNMDEFNIEFDTLNPPIEIPMEVEEQTDNDFDMPYTAPDVAAE